MEKFRCVQVMMLLLWLGLSCYILPGTAGAGEEDSQADWKDFEITDFSEIHSPVNGDDNTYLILFSY